MCTMYVCLFLHGINTLAYVQCMILYRVMNWALSGNFITHKHIALIELQMQMWPKLFISACTYRGSDHDGAWERERHMTHGAWWWVMVTCCSICTRQQYAERETHMHTGTNCKEVWHVSTYAHCVHTCTATYIMCAQDICGQKCRTSTISMWALQALNKINMQ